MEFNFLKKVWDNLTKATYSITVIEKGKRVPVLTFDSIEEYEFAGQSSTTSYPIESGFNIIDFKYDEPDTIQCKGVISRRGLIGVVGESYSLSANNKKDLIRKTETTLTDLKKSMRLVSIQSRSGALRENYTLTAFNIRETFDNFSLFEVDMSFASVILLDNAENLKNPNNKDTVNTGISQTQEVKI